jgi:CRISPR-associated protein Cmr4
MAEKTILLQPYYALALDPIHVGTGGMRLGRVDLPILREPGTNLPKIPGSTINGCARTGTAMCFNKMGCAGRGGEGGKNHCGKIFPAACEVCVPFGFSQGSKKSMQGLAQFFDAQILFFPIASMIGPIWITSPTILNGIGLTGIPTELENGFIALGKQLKTQEQLNFGWLLLEKASNLDEISRSNMISKIPNSIPPVIKEKIVLLSDELFGTVVNANLEVRTSNSIDPETGAAEDGALFTYEAIPRSTIFQFDVTYSSGKNYKVGGENLQTSDGKDITANWVKDKVERGLKYFETLGVGGMNTRGMGRIKILNLNNTNGE